MATHYHDNHGCLCSRNFAMWSKALRKRGFKLDYDSKSGGIRTTIFAKRIDVRRVVSVQLWGDDNNRACIAFDGCSDTTPTGFTTIEEMDKAITHESTRTDGKYAKRGSTYADRQRMAK